MSKAATFRVLWLCEALARPWAGVHVSYTYYFILGQYRYTLQQYVYLGGDTPSVLNFDLRSFLRHWPGALSTQPKIPEISVSQ